MAESMDVSLLKVPFESLKKISRDRKTFIDDMASILQDVNSLAESSTSNNSIAELERLMTRAEHLKSLLASTRLAEVADIQRCRARLLHLISCGPAPKEGVIIWTRNRFPRILADYLLRSGYNQTALRLIDDLKLQDLTERHIFTEAEPVIEGLRRQDCGPALEWCKMNRTKLKKAKSRLEFQLRTQEFIELVRSGDRLAAVQHARTYIAPWGSHYFDELQNSVTALVFGADTTCLRYRELFETNRWDFICNLFYQDLFKLNSMTEESLLVIQLQAGLLALKSPPECSDDGSKEDPLQHESFRILANGLPYAKRVHSQLLCAISKEVMNENNPPMVLNNGTVYSEKAIQKHTVDGVFTDPLTGSKFLSNEVKRAYVS